MVRENFCPACAALPIAMAAGTGAAVSSAESEEDKEKRLKKARNAKILCIIMFVLSLVVFLWYLNKCKKCKAKFGLGPKKAKPISGSPTNFGDSRFDESI